MGRSLKQIFELGLAKEVAEKAISNTIRDSWEWRVKKEKEEELTLSEALETAFSWSSSPEGTDYWLTIFKEARQYEESNYKNLIKDL